jgi:hypothetical protein
MKNSINKETVTHQLFRVYSMSSLFNQGRNFLEQQGRAISALAETFTGEEEPATANEEVVLGNKRVPDTENVDATNPSTEAVEEFRRLRYPLTLSHNYPARIIFKAVKVDGVDIAKNIGDTFTSLLEKANNFALKITGESFTSSVADEKVPEETAEVIEEAENQSKAAVQSYENNQGGKVVGIVELPLQRDLRFSDNAQYETANLGVLGGALEQGLRGQNAFAGATRNGQLVSTASALAAAAVAKGAGEVAGAAIGSKFGTPGAIVGASALGGTLEGLSPAVRSATRIASAPNQRTLFQQVQIRSFAFTFKMIANNAQEAQEIKNIVKFFRQELYPEKIALGESGVPLAYKFPNMFEIQVRNKNGVNPAFDIQRCYLRDIQTSFNSTASGMYNDGNFVEVDISLAFQEIVALDKQKIRDGY